MLSAYRVERVEDLKRLLESYSDELLRVLTAEEYENGTDYTKNIPRRFVDLDKSIIDVQVAALGDVLKQIRGLR